MTNETLGLLRRLEDQPHSVWIQKLNKGSQIQDCSSLGEWIGRPYGQINSLVWMCRVGRDDRWHYGHTLDEALQEALAQRRLRRVR